MWELFSARVVSGFKVGYISAAFAYVADMTTGITRAKGIGIIGTAFTLGFSIGLAVGGILDGSDPKNSNF